jgi:enamine deaminase RidA (YjgF/YER057c/UK114 family)
VPASIERAGNWIFGTGFRATSAPALFEQMREALGEAGSSLSRVVRLDQYYPDARCVPGYHQARKQAFGAGQIAPSTSVIVSALQTADAQMDVQVIATTAKSGYMAEPVQAGLNRPEASGYTPCLRVGDMIFVAGQLARDASGKLAAHGTGPETDYMARERLIPALEAAQSGLDLLLKAQVYLSRPEELPQFWQSWRRAFADRVPPTTVVPLQHPAFLTAEATVEINVIAAHRSAHARIREIKGEAPARVLDGLLFIAGLSGNNLGEIMQRARPIFAAAGSDPANVVRMLVFASDLADLGVPQMPFTAVKVPTGLTVDLWGYAPQT